MGSESSSSNSSKSISKSSKSLSKSSNKSSSSSHSDLIEELEDWADDEPILRRIRYGKYFIHNAAVTTGAAVTTTAVGTSVTYGYATMGAEIGAAGGPIGVIAGGSIGAAIGVIWTYQAAKMEDEIYENKAWHEYIVIEYGRRLQMEMNGFKYARFIRFDFGADGYSYCRQPTSEYWNTFGDERNNKRGELSQGVKCRGDIARLIQVVRQHDTVYNVATNNCKDFSQKIWIRMRSVN